VSGRLAIGVLETRGMASLMGATDAMLKTADVTICGTHRVGSGWLTVVVAGTVDSVEVAMAVGQQEAVLRGDLITAEVIARVDDRAMTAMPHGGAVRQVDVGRQALGLLETKGIVPLIAGADAMSKAAPVDLSGWTPIGGALAHVVVRGDVASVQAALDVGQAAAEKKGEVLAVLELPNPDAALGPLLPPPVTVEAVSAGGLGILETTGYAGAVGGFDQMIKASHVSIRRLVSGSGGRIGTLFVGDLDAVDAAADAASEGAKKAGVFEICHVVSRPSADVLSCFACPVVNSGRGGDHQAMGVIETRSTVALVKAVDQMLKAASVTFDGGYKAGAFLTASVIRGDVDAVRTALTVGAQEAVKYGELVSTHLIPNPMPELDTGLIHA